MLHYSLLYKKSGSAAHTTPSSLDFLPLGPHRALSRVPCVLYNRFSIVIYLIHSNVFYANPNLHSLFPLLPPLVSVYRDRVFWSEGRRISALTTSWFVWVLVSEEVSLCEISVGQSDLIKIIEKLLKKLIKLGFKSCIYHLPAVSP